MPVPINHKAYAKVWELIYLYDSVRSHMEDMLSSMQMIQSQLLSDLNDLSDDFDDLTEEINQCSKELTCFMAAPDSSEDSSEPHAVNFRFFFPANEDALLSNLSDEDFQATFPWELPVDERRDYVWN